MPQARLIVYGDLTLDLCLTANGYPPRGADTAVEDLSLQPGGSAANCAVTASRLGIPVDFVGLTGRDALSDMLVADLQANGVHTAGLRRVDTPPGMVIAVHDGGERTFFSYRGANGAADYGPLPPDLFTPRDALALTGYSLQAEPSRGTALALIAAARAAGACVALDPSYLFAQGVALDALPGLCDVFVPNEVEAALITGEPEPGRAAAALRRAGLGSVVITRGADGCLVVGEDGQVRLPALPVPHLADAVGAGDAFCGGFLAGRLCGLKDRDAAQLGQLAAAYVLAQPGGHAGAPTLAQALTDDRLAPTIRAQLARTAGI
ncbi:MAG: carbohydrate kinase family protein [Anaerolineae bacterium]|nr:carbohydrate kinase family protein [Anaerolineae bacterium]